MRALFVWLVLMTWISCYWLGLLGLGLVCVAGTRLWRGVELTVERQVIIEGDALAGIWVSPFAVCVTQKNEAHRSTTGQTWLCRDECAPGQWAELLRFLYRHTPTQAVGLSTSN
jgi:hypothetical protein